MFSRFLFVTCFLIFGIFSALTHLIFGRVVWIVPSIMSFGFLFLMSLCYAASQGNRYEEMMEEHDV